MEKIKRRKDGTYKRGVSGNPAGKAHDGLSHHAHVRIKRVLMKKAMGGNLRAIELLREFYPEQQATPPVATPVKGRDWNRLAVDEMKELRRLVRKADGLPPLPVDPVQAEMTRRMHPNAEVIN